jgi:hypothetical protein
MIFSSSGFSLAVLTQVLKIELLHAVELGDVNSNPPSPLHFRVSGMSAKLGRYSTSHALHVGYASFSA